MISTVAIRVEQVGDHRNTSFYGALAEMAKAEHELRRSITSSWATDTDMTRGFEIPKASPESAAVGIFDGLERGEDEIFPVPASQFIAEGWRTGAAKALERQFAAFVLENAEALA